MVTLQKDIDAAIEHILEKTNKPYYYEVRQYKQASKKVLESISFR